NRVGRLDPKTGEIKLLTLPTPKARPYGMAVNSKGTVFIVLFGTNKVASVDPKTLEFREYPLPDSASRPRRIAITSDDIVWYSDYARGYLGRLDPATGKVTEWPSPSGPKSEPYGISAINGVIWYSESGTTPNTVVRFDPRTEKFQSWTIPGGGNILRNPSVPRDRDALSLTARELHAALAHDGVDAVRQRLDQVVERRAADRHAQLDVGGRRTREPHVGRERVVEEIRVLRDQRDLAPQIIESP